jgi:hypothetical protein
LLKCTVRGPKCAIFVQEAGNIGADLRIRWQKAESTGNKGFAACAGASGDAGKREICPVSGYI